MAGIHKNIENFVGKDLALFIKRKCPNAYVITGNGSPTLVTGNNKVYYKEKDVWVNPSTRRTVVAELLDELDEAVEEKVEEIEKQETKTQPQINKDVLYAELDKFKQARKQRKQRHERL